MWLDIVNLILSLAIILLSCELFTNGIEWLGKKLKFGDGVVGSIFSAVGTCLPETMIPIIAILFNSGGGSVDIGIGAIIGAPFMLGTLAFFLTGISVFVFWKRRKTGDTMLVNEKILSRDIGFFIIIYVIGISATYINNMLIKYAIAAALVVCYVFYIILTVKNDTESHSKLETLYLSKYLKTKESLKYIILQIIIALIGIVFGAEVFVENIGHMSGLLGISVLALSLIITPIATELPEKFNSIIWISKKKDTLALGNITGAMVFQSCIPVAIGIVATTWKLDSKALISASLALMSALLVYISIKLKKKLTPAPLIAGGVFYAIFIFYLISVGFK